MAKEGIAPQDFELRSQGWSMDPFINGELDVASAMIYNEYHVVLESGIKPEELNVIDYAAYDLDFPGDLLFTTLEMVEQEPGLCVGMLRASLRGWQYAIEHPDETVEIVLKYDKSGVQTREHQLSMMDEISRLVNVPGYPLGYTDRAAIQRTLDALLRYDILSGPVQPDEVYTNEFWEQIQKEVQ
jgi:NitT/TauT family transport system substrate-binding protein